MRRVRCTGSYTAEYKTAGRPADGSLSGSGHRIGQQPVQVTKTAPDGVFEDSGIRHGMFAQLYDRQHDRIVAWPADQLDEVTE